MKRIAIGLLLSLLLLGCGSGSIAGATGVGNPPSTSVITVAAESGVVKDASDLIDEEQDVAENLVRKSGNKQKLIDVNGLEYRITKIEMCIDSISWDPDSLEVSKLDQNLHYKKGELVFAGGPWIFDLLTGKVLSGEHLSVNLPSMKYKRVKYYLNNHLSQSAVSIDGFVMHGSREIPFRLAMPCTMELKYSSRKEIVISENSAEKFSLLFNTDEWLANINPFLLGKIVGDTLLLAPSGNSSENYLAPIKNNIRKSGIVRLKK